jgi:hypothetical protein
MKKEETHTQGNGRKSNSKNTILIKRSANVQNNSKKLLKANVFLKSRN